jgi:hypothetical protein
MFFLSFFYFKHGITNQTQYKLYCLYTPIYESLFNEYFLPNLKDDFELVLEVHPQECASARFLSEGWNHTMLKKLKLMERAILENWGQVFFHSDIDIIFLKPILQRSLAHLGNRDFVVQQSWPRNKLCAGFFVMRGNEKTLRFVQKAYALLENNLCIHDQAALQIVLADYKDGEIDWKFLPIDEYPTGRRILKDSEVIYSKNSPIELTDSMILFHASCCIGLENKCLFLKQIHEKFNQMISQ